MSEIPRRAFLEKRTKEENLITDAMAAVENLGAHPLLTDCVILLEQARNKLSDYVDRPKSDEGAEG